MLALKTKTAAHAKIGAVAIAITSGNGRKGLQPVDRNKHPVLFDSEAAQKSPQSGGIGLVIVAVVFVIGAQQFLGRFFAP